MRSCIYSLPLFTVKGHDAGSRDSMSILTGSVSVTVAVYTTSPFPVAFAFILTDAES